MISIITPVYNGKRFIEFCIQNVIEQDCPEVEHIIVDGGSTDGTVDIIKKFSQRHPHIRWISEKDSGQSDAMNKGVHMAKGAILGFLNVDDFYEPGALNRALDLFKPLPEPSLLVGNCNVWDNEAGLWFVSRPSRISFENLLSGRFMEAFPMNPAAYFYHASLHKKIGPYNVHEHYAMDMEFILKATKTAHIAYFDEPFGNYRYLKGTKTFCNDNEGKTQIIVRKIVYDFLRDLPLLKRLKLILRYELPRSIIGKIINRKSVRIP